ncbi:26372_t:CDS:2 [Gigaspora margarita]|uniref:26372_t:CDS:1 n=1 Tax=Gigaspora margarita TaxID=4874 RepID=A0ABN7UHD8_GIGMA|nr:26372_t:CDS:2 [Gigaspora margarita]
MAKFYYIPLYYPLTETKTSDYKERTELNVQDADTTLILTLSDFDSKKDGTAYTIDKTNGLNKQLKIIYLDKDRKSNLDKIIEWTKDNTNNLNISLNISGNCPGIQVEALEFIYSLLNKKPRYKFLFGFLNSTSNPTTDPFNGHGDNLFDATRSLYLVIIVIIFISSMHTLYCPLYN